MEGIEEFNGRGSYSGLSHYYHYSFEVFALNDHVFGNVRVLADGHIPWACEAFSRLHGPALVHNSALIK